MSDTTGHDFSWLVESIVVHLSRLFYVSAIDEHNVWAVGKFEIDKPDTVWNTPKTRNNALKWNGSEFEFFQIPVKSFDGFFSIQELNTRLTFSENDIWHFSGAASYVHWASYNWESEYIPEMMSSPKAAWRQKNMGPGIKYTTLFWWKNMEYFWK